MRRSLILLILTECIFHASNAQITFQKTFGRGDFDLGYSVHQTIDGGYIIAGVTEEFIGSSSNIYLIKTDINGNNIWTKTYDKSGGGADGYSVQQTDDGGYIIAGKAHGVLLVKTDANGDSIWTRVFGNGVGKCIQQTTDGGYIVVGYTEGERKVYLLKTDVNGDSIWTRSFGGTITNRGHSVQQTADGGYIVAGETLNSGSGYFDIYLVKTDADGNIMWERTFGGPDLDSGYSVQQTNDGGYIVTGHIYQVGGALIKTDVNGDSVWTKIIGGSSFTGSSVRQTSDNGYIVAGTKGDGFLSDAMLIKTDVNGDSLWIKSFGDVGDDGAFCVGLTNDGGYIMTGWTTGFGATGWDIYLIKIDSNGYAAPFTGTQSQPININNILVYPNPSNGYFSVSVSQNFIPPFSIQIANALGQIINTENHQGNQPFQIDLSKQPKGIYFLSLTSKGEAISVKKVITY